MVDAHPHDEGQVIDLAAAIAARAAPVKLTSELFEAAGVPVTERPPSDPTRKDDLVPTKSKSEVLRQGTEAMLRLSGKGSRDWADWRMVLAALEVGRHAAMLEAETNKPRGRGYCTAFAKWLRCHEAFEAIDQADRKYMFDCLDNLSAIEEWRAGLSPAQLIKWNYPPTVLRVWKRSCRPPSEPQAPKQPSESSKSKPALSLTPQELHQQLKHISLDTFYRHIMPDEWCRELADKALGLASAVRLIAALERKLPASKITRAALKHLRSLATA